MNYIISLLYFNLLFFSFVFDSMAMPDSYEVSLKDPTYNTSHTRTKRALKPFNQEASSPASPPKKTRLIEEQMPAEPQSTGASQFSEDFFVGFVMNLSPCTEVLEDSDDEDPSPSIPPARYNPFARLNAIAQTKLQENFLSVEGTIRRKWHRNIYNSTFMLPESNG